jgi:hypothetical protein
LLASNGNHQPSAEVVFMTRRFRPFVIGAWALSLSMLAASAVLRADDNDSAAGDSSSASDSASAYPKPSPIPISWELTFKHSDPKRITVEVPGDATPTVYWYVAYTVTNEADKSSHFNPDLDRERTFYPKFEMRARDGSIIPSDDGISPLVFEAIKKEEHNKYLERPTLMGGRILLGEDQARDSVAIWPEPNQRMGSFVIFASGMWGETAPATDSSGQPLKDASGQPILLHKTSMMSYHVDGDETHFAPIRQTGETFIMR